MKLLGPQPDSGHSCPGLLRRYKKDRYLDGKPDSEKARHHRQDRIGWQESSPQNNFRRIIASKIPKNQFCNHKINYIPEENSELSLNLLLALLNSSILDWFFRLGSTNAAVSHYQIYNLPIPPLQNTTACNGLRLTDLGGKLSATERSAAECLEAMSVRIQDLEARRIVLNRSDRSKLAPESQPIQDAIDAVLFKCYGLSDEDAEYVKKRLTEML